MHRVTIEQQLVLASGSPRRRELLGLLGLVFSARVAQVDEQIMPAETAVTAAQRFAREKANAIAEQLNPASYPVVIGADTIVVLDGKALGKPISAADAEETLRQLRGREHAVYTALSLIDVPGNKRMDVLACTSVPMRDYSDEEIYLYVRSGDPFDKAGAYGIQNESFRPVAKLDGCYANVMGLPLCHLTVALRELGIDPPADVPQVCQARTGYRCPVFASILAGVPE